MEEAASAGATFMTVSRSRVPFPLRNGPGGIRGVKRVTDTNPAAMWYFEWQKNCCVDIHHLDKCHLIEINSLTPSLPAKNTDCANRSMNNQDFVLGEHWLVNDAIPLHSIQ